jgi:hypothetical protein
LAAQKKVVETQIKELQRRKESAGKCWKLRGRQEKF